MAVEINYSETRGPNVDEFLSSRPTPSCFIPICLYSFMANKPFLFEYLPWAISRCERPRSIIGENIDRLREYMIEEIAFFLALYQEGYITEIYPKNYGM